MVAPSPAARSWWASRSSTNIHGTWVAGAARAARRRDAAPSARSCRRGTRSNWSSSSLGQAPVGRSRTPPPASGRRWPAWCSARRRRAGRAPRGSRGACRAGRTSARTTAGVTRTQDGATPVLPPAGSVAATADPRAAGGQLEAHVDLDVVDRTVPGEAGAGLPHGDAPQLERLTRGLVVDLEQSPAHPRLAPLGHGPGPVVELDGRPHPPQVDFVGEGRRTRWTDRPPPRPRTTSAG